jgi:hypothetical protein
MYESEKYANQLYLARLQIIAVQASAGAHVDVPDMPQKPNYWFLDTDKLKNSI